MTDTELNRELSARDSDEIFAALFAMFFMAMAVVSYAGTSIV